MKKIFVFLTLIIITQIKLISQTEPEWIRFFNNENNIGDGGMSVAVDSEKNVIVVGTANDKMCVLKYDPNGNLLWEKRDINYSGISVVVDTSDNIYALGMRTNEANLVKYSKTGTLLWNIVRYMNYSPSGLTISPAGNPYVYGMINGCDITKFSTTGTVLWNKKYIGIGSFSGGTGYNKRVKVDRNENAYVTFCTRIGGSSHKQDIMILKYGPNGDTLWVRSFSETDSSYETSSCLDIDENSNVYIGGITSVNGVYKNILASYDSSGNFRWNRSTTELQEAAIAIKYKNGYFYTSGSTTAGNNNYSPTRKYTTSGDLLWTSFYNESGNTPFKSIVIDVDNNGNVYCGGELSVNDIGTITFDNNGNKIRVTSYTGTGMDVFRSMALDDNKLILTGFSFRSGFENDVITIKYGIPIGITQLGTNVPSGFILHQNYPNPFNPSTLIKFDIPVTAFTKLSIYNVLGILVQTPIEQELIKGSYGFEINIPGFPSGVYFYELTSGMHKETKKMVLVR